jgi:hypothetical protein
VSRSLGTRCTPCNGTGLGSTALRAQRRGRRIRRSSIRSASGCGACARRRERRARPTEARRR